MELFHDRGQPNYLGVFFSEAIKLHQSAPIPRSLSPFDALWRKSRLNSFAFFFIDSHWFTSTDLLLFRFARNERKNWVENRFHAKSDITVPSLLYVALDFANSDKYNKYLD